MANPYHRARQATRSTAEYRKTTPYADRVQDEGIASSRQAADWTRRNDNDVLSATIAKLHDSQAMAYANTANRKARKRLQER